MSSSNKLYIIVRDIEEDDAESNDFLCNLRIFIDLKEALNELDNLYKTCPYFKYYNYHIKVFNKINNKYIITHQTYYHQIGYS